MFYVRTLVVVVVVAVFKNCRCVYVLSKHSRKIISKLRYVSGGAVYTSECDLFLELLLSDT